MLKIPASIKDAYLRPQKTLVTVMAHPVFTEPMYRALRDISRRVSGAESRADSQQHHLAAGDQSALHRGVHGRLERRDGPRAAVAAVPDRSARQLFPPVLGCRRRDRIATRRSRRRKSKRSCSTSRSCTRGIARLRSATHASRPLPTGAEPGEARLVLVVRGDLLKKYPTAVIYAQQAKWTTDEQGRAGARAGREQSGAVHQDADLQGGDRSGRPLPRLRSHRERRRRAIPIPRPTIRAGSS